MLILINILIDLNAWYTYKLTLNGKLISLKNKWHKQPEDILYRIRNEEKGNVQAKINVD